MISGIGPTHVIQCWMSDTSVRLLCCLRSKLYRKHTAPRATLAHTSISLHTPLHSAVRPRRIAHPSLRPLSRPLAPTSPHPQSLRNPQTTKHEHTTPHTNTHNHTRLSVLSAPPLLSSHERHSCLRSLRQPCCIWSPPFTPLVHGPQLLCSLEREPTPSTRTHTV